MDYKSKKIVIAVLVGIMLAINIGVIALYSSGIMEVITLELEGMEINQDISKNAVIVMQAIVCICNIIILFLLKNILDHKTLAITLTSIQLLLGSVINIIFGIVIIVVLAIKTEGIEPKPKPALPELNELTQKNIKLYLIVAILILGVFYSPLLDVLPIEINSILVAIIVSVGVYIIEAIALLFAFGKELKRDFLFFIKNFKTYLAHTLPIIGKSLLIYFVVSLIVAFIVKSQATNQQIIGNLPIWYSGILAILVAPVLEEMLFRGLFRKIIKNDKLFIIISSFLFGLAHVTYKEENILMYLHILPYAILGYGFAKTYVKTKNICTNIFCHMAWNTFAFLLMLLIKI